MSAMDPSRACARSAAFSPDGRPAVRAATITLLEAVLVAADLDLAAGRMPMAPVALTAEQVLEAPRARRSGAHRGCCRAPDPQIVGVRGAAMPSRCTDGRPGSGVNGRATSATSARPPVELDHCREVAHGRRHARVGGVKISDDEIGMFLGGLLAVLVRNRAFELAGDLSDDEWNAQREELTRRAYDDVTAAFPSR